MSEREEILAAIGASASPLSPLVVEPNYGFQSDDLWSSFRTELEELGGRLVDKEKVEAYIDKTRWVDGEAEALVGGKSTVGGIWDAEVGFAVAKCAIAQTGTLVFESGTDSHRLTTLVPAVSVVFVSRRAIVRTMAEAFDFVSRTNRTCVFVTGPSRTADIEGVLVRGVHGPGELLVVVT